jgi:PAS domain S-box-containing protein
MNAPTEPRLLRRALIVLAGMLCSAAAGLVLLGEQQAARDAGCRADRLRQLQRDGDALLIGMVNQETSVRGYLDTGVADFLEPYVEGRRQVAGAVQRLRRAGLQGTARLDATLAPAAFWQEWAAGRTAAVDPGSTPVISTAAWLEGKRRFDAFRAAQTRLEGGLGREVATALADAADRSRDARLAALIGGVGGAGSLVLLGLLLLGWWTLRPVLRLAQAAAAMAAGEPVTIAPTTRRDEVGALSRALVHLQNAAIERERFFTLALDANVITNPSGGIVDASPAMERITGFTKPELLSRSLMELVHPDDLEGVVASIGNLAHGARVTGFEVRTLCKDGSHRYLSWSAAASPVTGAIYWVGRDVTEERRTRDALEERAQLLNLAHDAILVRDIAGKDGITYWTAGAEATYGWSADEALGRVSHQLLETEFPRPLPEVEEEVLRTGRWQGELTQSVHDGGRVVIDSRWALRTDAAGHPDGVLEVNRDITERKRLERALEESTAELVRASQAKTEFLSRMSHELRTPLNAILGFSQLLETDVEDRNRDFLRRIQDAGRHLLALINDVLDISRVESGTMPVSIEPVSIAGVVTVTSELIKPLAAARGIVVSTQLSGACDQHVLADLQGLKQVMLNLMSNAVKYNREGGHISVVAEPHDDAVRVAVANTGPRIPRRERDRLFQAFDRLGAETTGVEGTGLGLMLSRQLLIAMGGSISVESSDRWTTFSIELPAAGGQEELLVGRAFTADDPAALSDRRVVMYVEDSLSYLQLVERIFERQRRGFTVLPAMQGSLALELAREHCPDLILLDVHLPDISGHELLRRLRADQRTAGIPVVVISADVSADQVTRMLDAGARAYLAKPLEVDRLLAVLDEVLGGPRPTVPEH